MKFTELFSDTECNTGRQLDLDLAKAVAVLFLPFVHTIIECASEESLLHGFPFVLDCYIGGPMSAPVFMFAMGVGIQYSVKNSPKELVKRAGILFLVGYLLNVFRFLLPYLAGYAISHDAGQFLDPLPYRFFGNDILQYAPLALLFIALFKQLKLSKTMMFGITVLTLMAGWALNGIDFHNPALNTALGYFVGTEDAAGLLVSDFPLLNWLIFSVSGYIFGYYLKRVSDKSTFYKYISIPALIVVLIYFPLATKYEWGMFGPGENAYYHLAGYDGFTFLCMVLALLGIYHLISVHLPNKVMQFFVRVSRGMTAFYCVHWVFVRVITNVILYLVNGTQELPEGQAMLLSAAICIVTLAIVFKYQDFKQKRRIRNEA